MMMPKLLDLVGTDAQVSNKDGLNLILNVEPKKEWLKDHPMARGVKYIPISIVETLLTTIFQEWKVEVICYSQLFNSVSCHVRLHYKNPVTQEWNYHDGLGAVGVQTDKGESAANLNAIKQDAVMKALPAAKSYAIKDAAEHLGKLFGRDMNRKDSIDFKPQFTTQWTREQQP